MALRRVVSFAGRAHSPTIIRSPVTRRRRCTTVMSWGGCAGAGPAAAGPARCVTPAGDPGWGAD